MAKKKETNENEAVTVEEKAVNTSVSNKTTMKKQNTTLKLRDSEAKIRLMTLKGKRTSKTLEDWLKPSNFRLLNQASQNLIKNGKTALQMLDEADS